MVHAHTGTAASRQERPSFHPSSSLSCVSWGVRLPWRGSWGWSRDRCRCSVWGWQCLSGSETTGWCLLGDGDRFRCGALDFLHTGSPQQNLGSDPRSSWTCLRRPQEGARDEETVRKGLEIPRLRESPTACICSEEQAETENSLIHSPNVIFPVSPASMALKRRHTASWVTPKAVFSITANSICVMAPSSSASNIWSFKHSDIMLLLTINW